MKRTYPKWPHTNEGFETFKEEVINLAIKYDFNVIHTSNLLKETSEYLDGLDRGLSRVVDVISEE